MQTYSKTIALYVLIFVAGASFGVYAPKLKKEKVVLPSSRSIREQGLPYKFIHPLLASYDSVQPENDIYTPIQKELENYVQNKTQDNSINTGSIYFRDLGSGRWIGINEQEKYGPASLLKVAIMIAYFRSAETGALDLQKKVVYKPVAQVPFETPSNLTPNQSYSFDELITNLITDSDNGAKDMLLANIDNKLLNSVYVSLGIENPDNTMDYKISTKNYALFLRILYNSTYLSREYSEKALSLLNQASFTEGLVAGVPQNVAVAHKFGEKVNDDGNGKITNIEFHDCGIVFAPAGDYVLCVMTKGQDRSKLIQTIKEASSLVYDKVSKLQK